jgi:hypothetical protein
LADGALRAIPRPAWAPTDGPVSTPLEAEIVPPRRRGAEALRRHIRDVCDSLAPRELDALASFADFLRARRGASIALGHEHDEDEPPPSSTQPKSEEPLKPEAKA